jgi:hypothetical protein
VNYQTSLDPTPSDPAGAPGHIDSVVRSFAPPVNHDYGGDPNEVSHTGTRGAIAQLFAPGALAFIKAGETEELEGLDGHRWLVEADADAFFWTASRPRTDAERAHFIDVVNDRVSPSPQHFSRARWITVSRITMEVEHIACCPIPRSGRRQVQEKLRILSGVAFQLLNVRDLDMAEVRATLAPLGIEVPNSPLWH